MCWRVLTDILPDVPGFVFDVLQTQHLRDFDRRHGAVQIHLVGEEQYWNPFAADIWMIGRTNTKTRKSSAEKGGLQLKTLNVVFKMGHSIVWVLKCQTVSKNLK